MREYPSIALRKFPQGELRKFPNLGGQVAAGGGGGDPHFSSVVLLLPLNGSDTDTTTTDESNTGHTVTFSGDAQLDTAQKKFGTTSCLLQGSSDHLEIPDSADWELGTGDWTIEGHMRWAGDAFVFQLLFGQWLTAGSEKSWCIFRDGAGADLELFLSVNGSTSITQITAAFVLSLDTWYHIAADYDGTTYRLYVDGVVLGTSTTARTLNNAASKFTVGDQADGADPFNGWADNIRITKGVARYAGAFTPPSAEYPTS